MIPPRVRRKVFISYFRADKSDVENFVNYWGLLAEGIYSADSRSLRSEVINGQNAQYVIGKIRQEQIADSTVAMVLIGSCTHSRRHVDWEIKASLRQGIDCKPNGLLGVLLPSQGNSAHLPPRLKENWDASETATPDITLLQIRQRNWRGGSKTHIHVEKPGRT